MSIIDYWKAVIAGERSGFAATAFRAALWLLTGLTRLGFGAKLKIYQWGLKKQYQLNRPVIVIGNLSLGGTGKTTATVYLIRRLAEAGLTAGAILRGYGRKASEATLLVSDGHARQASTLEAGDEAMLLALLLPKHPVAVGVRREKAAELLIQETQAEAVVLDDGFQYLRLAREANIVLVDASHNIEQDQLFPAGTLREPLTNLRRATQVWITHAELVPSARVAQLRQWVQTLAPKMPVAVTAHRTTAMRSLTNSPSPQPGRRVIGFSGLGNPASLQASLTQLGYEVKHIHFADHHQYVPADWQHLHAAALDFGAQHLVTTEKDAVKLPPPPPELPSVHVLGCELEVISGGEIIDELLESLQPAAPV